jgi:membrane protease YdiL (CAAX protease family)
MEANKITLKTLTISIAAVFAIETVFRLAISGQPGSHLPALGIIRCLEALLLVFITGRFEKDPNAIGLSRSKMLPGFSRGLIWSVCFGIAAGVLFLVLFTVGINPLKLVDTPLPSAPRQIFIFFLVGGVIGPIGEEIFFRGIIFGFFRRWGVYAAILTSTALFVLPHFDGHHLPLTQIVGGIVFAIAYEKEKSLMVPIIIHCLGNMAIFSLAFFS